MERIQRIYNDLYRNKREIPAIDFPERVEYLQENVRNVPTYIPSTTHNYNWMKTSYVEKIPIEKNYTDYVKGDFLELIPSERVARGYLEVKHSYREIPYGKRISRVYEGEPRFLNISVEEYFARERMGYERNWNENRMYYN